MVVSYNSNAGNGMLGQGWTLSGLSMITRSTKNLYLDNKTTPVELTLNDVFALDGQRLLLKTGTYGLNGATYATESESFSFVTSYGQSGQGPTWFQIETKEGVVYEYGNSTTSRFLMESGSTVLVWRLNKILYKDGNYIEFKYTDVDRDSRIDEILYTGNAAMGLTPYNKIKFNYSIRTDINKTYEAGQSVVG